MSRPRDLPTTVERLCELSRRAFVAPHETITWPDALPRESIEHGKELVFAEKAAIGSIGAVGGIFHFPSFDEFMRNSECTNEFLDGGAVVRRIAW